MDNEELQRGLVKLVSEQTQRSRENEVLREAARIIFNRTNENPGTVQVRMRKAYNIDAEITVNFVQR